MSIITECTENHFLFVSFISQVPLCTRRGSPLQRQGFNKQREATHQMSALPSALPGPTGGGGALRTPGWCCREERRSGVLGHQKNKVSSRPPPTAPQLNGRLEKVCPRPSVYFHQQSTCA